MKKDAARRTQPSLLDFFCRQSEHRQQFDHNFDDRFNHGGCGSDLRINLQPTCEIFDTFKDIKKGIVAFPDVFGRLADSYIIIGYAERSRVTLTERRTAIPEKITFAGGNA